jgi:hypothetical protein
MQRKPRNTRGEIRLHGYGEAVAVGFERGGANEQRAASSGWLGLTAGFNWRGRCGYAGLFCARREAHGTHGIQACAQRCRRSFGRREWVKPRNTRKTRNPDRGERWEEGLGGGRSSDQTLTTEKRRHRENREGGRRAWRGRGCPRNIQATWKGDGGRRREIVGGRRRGDEFQVLGDGGWGLGSGFGGRGRREEGGIARKWGRV